MLPMIEAASKKAVNNGQCRNMSAVSSQVSSIVVCFSVFVSLCSNVSVENEKNARFARTSKSNPQPATYTAATRNPTCNPALAKRATRNPTRNPAPPKSATRNPATLPRASSMTGMRGVALTVVL